MDSMRGRKTEELFSRFPTLRQTIEVLDYAGIPYAIGGSGCLFLLGNDRAPDDVDIYLQNDDHDRADKLFGIASYLYRSDQEEVRNSNPEGDHAIQLTSGLVLHVAGRRYDLQMTEEVLKMRLSVDEALLYPPEDVLLIKALLQRGADVNKHDIDDISAFLAIHPSIRREYLSKRIQALNANDRVGGILGV